MSALARFFHLRGDRVCGYDRTVSPITRQLVAEGIPVHYDDNPDLVPDDVDLVVYTPAVPEDTAVFRHVVQRGFAMRKRSQVLGDITRGKRCIAVAGSHGKTSTSSMVAHILSHTEEGCSAFLGGVAKNFNSNVVVDNRSDFVVVEADEFDRSFLTLHPHCAVVTATDADHLDVYGSRDNMVEAFRQFASQVDADGTLVLKQGVTLEPGAHAGHDHDGHDGRHEPPTAGGVAARVVSYTAQGVEADYYPWNVRNYNGNIFFDLRTPKGVFYDMELPNAPLYNIENAVAAAAVVMTVGVTEHQLRYGLKTYAGVQRRFDYRIKRDDLVMIDDYAHHPREIAACIESIRYLYPGKRVVGIFQPHLYTRTRDFAPEFAAALSKLDKLILLDIYPAREEPIPGVTSELIYKDVTAAEKMLIKRDELMDVLKNEPVDVLVTFGAGNIDRFIRPITQMLNER